MLTLEVNAYNLNQDIRYSWGSWTLNTASAAHIIGSLALCCMLQHQPLPYTLLSTMGTNFPLLSEQDLAALLVVWCSVILRAVFARTPTMWTLGIFC